MGRGRCGTAPGVGKCKSNLLRMRQLDLNLPKGYQLKPTPAERSASQRGRVLNAKQSKAKRGVGTTSTSDVARQLKKVLKYAKGITFSHRKGSVTVSATGVTASLMPDSKTTLKATVEPDGTVGGGIEKRDGALTHSTTTKMGQPLKVEMAYRDLKVAFTFSSSDSSKMSFDRWKYEVTWGSTAPDINSLKTIFTKGEAGMRGTLGALGRLKSLNDVKAVKNAISKHVDPISDAVKAAGQAAGVRKGISVSFVATGPLHKSADQEWSVMTMVTIRF